MILLVLNNNSAVVINDLAFLEGLLSPSVRLVFFYRYLCSPFLPLQQIFFFFIHIKFRHGNPPTPVTKRIQKEQGTFCSVLQSRAIFGQSSLQENEKRA